MSALTGRRASAQQPTRAQGLDLQSSEYGKVLPVLYGRTRVSGRLIWYGDFEAHAQEQNVGKGGGGSISSYTYSASFALAIADGEGLTLNRIWEGGGARTLAELNGTFKDGTAGQAPWSHWTGAEALNYSLTAYAGFLNVDLGSTPSLPNLNFDMVGLLPFNAGTVDDAEPSAIIVDVLTHPDRGIGFDATLDVDLLRDYCTATGLFLSPAITEEQAVMELLEELLELANSTVVDVGNALKFIPYSDEDAAGNGANYVAPVTPVAGIGPDAFISTPRIRRRPSGDVKNTIRVEYRDAANDFNTAVVEAKDQADIDARGIRSEETVRAHAITNTAVARRVVQRVLQRRVYIRNEFEFSLPLAYFGLEPMDVVQLTDPLTGLNLTPVRITEIEEEEDTNLRIVAEEFAAGVSEGAQYATEINDGYHADPHGAPDTTASAVFFRAPQLMAPAEVWIGAAGDGPNWGGAHVWVSYDDASYTRIGTIGPGCRYGVLTGALPVGVDPDVTNSFEVDFLGVGGQLNGGSQNEADRLVTLMLIDGELVAYTGTVLNGDGTYTLGGDYLRRGVYSTAIAAHNIGAPWLRVDDNIIRYPFDVADVGTTIYVKFQAFNLWGSGLEDLAALPAQQYVLGDAQEIPDAPPVPTNFSALPIADGVDLRWTNPAPAAVDLFEVQISPDANPSNFVHLAYVSATTLADHFDDGATWYYRVRARNHRFVWSDYSAILNQAGKVVEEGATYGAPAGTPVGDRLAEEVTDKLDGKSRTFRTSVEPTAENIGDLWFDPASGIVKRWDGSGWELMSNISGDGLIPFNISLQRGDTGWHYGGDIRWSIVNSPSHARSPDRDWVLRYYGVTNTPAPYAATTVGVFSVAPGDLFRSSVHIKRTLGTVASARVITIFIDKAGNRVNDPKTGLNYFASGDIVSSTEYDESSDIVVTPAGAVQAKLAIQIVGPSANVHEFYFSDFRLDTYLGDAQYARTLANPGFEQGEYGWITTSKTFQTTTVTDVGSGRAVYFENNAGDAKHLTSPSIAANEGEVYEAIARVFGDGYNGTATLFMQFFDVNENQIGADVSLDNMSGTTSGFITMTGRAIAPAGTTSVRFRLWTYNQTAGRLYVDNCDLSYPQGSVRRVDNSAGIVTVNPFETIEIDTTLGTVAIDLPSTPQHNTWVDFVDVENHWDVSSAVIDMTFTYLLRPNGEWGYEYHLVTRAFPGVKSSTKFRLRYDETGAAGSGGWRVENISGGQ